MEPLTRTQVLIAMGVTAVVLLMITKLWLKFGGASLLSIQLTGAAILSGIGIGIGITAVSSVAYRVWPAYRQSADYYLELVLKPLIWPDILWLGLLPGLSEELLFRGVMLPAIGLNAVGLIVSSLLFGVLHLSAPKQWPYVVWATFIGLLLGYSALATGNLLVPVIAHVITNWVSGSSWKFKR